MIRRINLASIGLLRRIFLAVITGAVLLTSSCASSDHSNDAYQTFVNAVKDGFVHLIPTAVPREDMLAVPENTPVYEINSKQDMFLVLQDSLYAFKPDVYILIKDYDLFLLFWSDLSSEGALHSSFESREVQIEYNSKSPCTMKLNFTYNAAGQILKKIQEKQTMVFEDDDAGRLYQKSMLILKEITSSDMSELQKETAIHDYIVTHTKYSVSGDPEILASAESVIIEGKGQCQGYAEAASLLLGLSGIPSRIVSGTAFGDDGAAVAHAWNQVLINDVWYHVDITWDDPIPDTGEYAAQVYLNRSDAFMKTDHTWSALFLRCPVDFPAAGADKAGGNSAS